jgi:uncharacterized small protein (DUF1192 family)
MRKRSKYKPKGVRLDTMAWLKQGMAPVRTSQHAINLRVKNHNALTEVAHGRGTRDQVDVLIACMNMAEALYRVNPDLGLQYSPEIKAAQDALYTMGKRSLDKGRLLFTGPELTAMNTGMEIHDAQLDVASIAELEKALDLVAKEIRLRKARQIA